mgnify:CR=1 FL=1|tara:strand:+ start:308 stop:760 length:453 start_codon:yes stop_codon:yes gene_type:complete
MSYSIGWSKVTQFVRAKELIKENNSIFYFEVIKPVGDNEEWKIARDVIEEFYEFCEKNKKQFSIIMDASKLEVVDIMNAIQWVVLFLKHKDITSEFVTCSCLVTTSVNVKQGVWYFLKYYSPIKPFVVESTATEARTFIESHVLQKDIPC